MIFPKPKFGHPPFCVKVRFCFGAVDIILSGPLLESRNGKRNLALESGPTNSKRILLFYWERTRAEIERPAQRRRVLGVAANVELRAAHLHARVD